MLYECDRGWRQGSSHFWSSTPTIDEMRARFNWSGTEMFITLFEEMMRVQAKDSGRLRK